MNREQITEKVLVLILENLAGDPGFELTEDTRLKSEIGMDSLDILELVVELEREFDTTLDENDLPHEDDPKISDLKDLVS